MRILYITSNRVGDAVLSSGVLAELMRRHPDARVTVATGSVNAGLFKGVPNLDRIVHFQKRTTRGLHWFALWQQVVLGWWDIVVDMRRSVIGWAVPRGKLYRGEKSNRVEHKVIEAARLLGMEGNPPSPELWISQADHDEADAILKDDARPLLCIGPTANWQGKIWPADRFLELAKRLTAKGGILEDARIGIIGAPGEEEQAELILKGLPKNQVIDMVGVSLGVAGAIFERSALYVGNDSGLMHMSAAAGTPTVGLFGPSKDEFYAPWGQKCIHIRTPQSFDELISAPDYDRHTTPSLMTGITVEAALDACETLLRRMADHPG